MAPKSEELLRKKKEAKQKKLLLLLVPVLAVLVVIQGPKLMKQIDSAKEQTEHVQGQVVEGFREVAPEERLQAGAGQTTVTESTTAVLLATSGLPNTDTPPEADEGQLISFTRFSARDPFVQLVVVVDDGSQATSDATGSTTTTTSTATTGTSTSATSGTTTTTDSGSGTSDTAATQVSISVNGTIEVVAIGDTFPANDPAFRLVAIEGSIVKIGLSAGSFSNGVETLDLEVGDSVTLISQPDGGRFTLKIVELG